MKTYSVKQLAEMFETNPETVRRWIRDGKLKSTQLSKKTGNVVTQAQLEAFLKIAPKYLPKFAGGLVALSPLTAIVLAATSGIATVLTRYYKETNKGAVRARPEDLKAYLRDQIAKEEEAIEKKKALIEQTQSEIADATILLEKYRFLLNDDKLLDEALKLTGEATEECE